MNLKGAIPTYNKTSVAKMYGISLKSLKAWFEDEEFQKELGPYRGRTFTPAQIDIIIKHFGPFEDY